MCCWRSCQEPQYCLHHHKCTELFVSALGKQGLRLTSAPVASCRKQQRRKSCQEDDHWVGGTGWTAQRVWTEHRRLAGQGYTGAGNSGGTAWEDGQEHKKVLSRCWTDGQEHLGWWPGGEGDRTRRKASVSWGVGGSVLLLPDGKLQPVTRMDVVRGPKSRCLLYRLLHHEHLGALFLAQCSRTGPSPFLLRTPILLAPSPISNRENQMKSMLIFSLFIPVFYLYFLKILSIGVFIDFTKGSRPNPLYILYMLQT